MVAPVSILLYPSLVFCWVHRGALGGRGGVARRTVGEYLSFLLLSHNYEEKAGDCSFIPSSPDIHVHSVVVVVFMTDALRVRMGAGGTCAAGGGVGREAGVHGEWCMRRGGLLNLNLLL